jgi:hypothetical protein
MSSAAKLPASPFVVAWAFLGFVARERREAFNGPDQPARPHRWACGAAAAEAVDLFGNPIPLTLSDGQLQLSLSLDPVFITLTN